MEASQAAAFDRCIDVMIKLLLKYGPAILEQWEREELEKKENGVVS